MASFDAQHAVQALDRAQREWKAYGRPNFYSDFASGFSQNEQQFVGRFLKETGFVGDRVRPNPAALADLMEQLDTLDEFKASTRPQEIKDGAMQMCFWLIAQRARKLYPLD
ncbi:hypothetical protein psal_cds_794 [Pandoravirus salinus]|uniref:Uncharacterized protein n=1 Tax=Pandoravirus salinus TaxID=1349410 RepID=S4W2P4_9VIRU|nr:hypothetical protein psal_cds_794 [Pandoravirus salinus]AGO84812.1 hypothetical protein psal_cds_794 [Pandoravirus salinus]